jgi:NADH-quinone oxidoreductase subunit A
MVALTIARRGSRPGRRTRPPLLVRIQPLENGFTSGIREESRRGGVESYYQAYGTLVGLLVAGVGLVAVAFTAARIIAPHRVTVDKRTTYECGIDPVGEGWSQTQIRYYIYAFLFVIFDVESVFLFPWATIFERLGYQAVVEMLVFVFILALGLLYAYRKKVLQWA